ncbi:hypothetical protein DFS34DRAFT_339534 [Phlyctochytrium arcticum]|nr:hypothetical protein DFS34DRAFT_339534 [Phlyctochytrium arcticum]
METIQSSSLHEGSPQELPIPIPMLRHPSSGHAKQLPSRNITSGEADMDSGSMNAPSILGSSRPDLGSMPRGAGSKWGGSVQHSQVRFGVTGALRRGVRHSMPKKTIAENAEKGLEDGIEEEIGIPSWAEHRSAGEKVLNGRLMEGIVMVAILLCSFLLVRLLPNAVMGSWYGPSIGHLLLLLAGGAIGALGSKMVSESIHHALTIIALTRGADCYIMASNYQTKNPFVLCWRALRCCLRNAKDTKMVELLRLLLISTLLFQHIALSLVLSFAMVSVEWEEIPVHIGSGTCEKPTYQPLAAAQISNIFRFADSGSPAIFEEDGRVGVVGGSLPRGLNHIQVVSNNPVVFVKADVRNTVDPCASVPASVASSPNWGDSAMVCDAEYRSVDGGAQIFAKIGIPRNHCTGCSSSLATSYTYLSVIATVEYYLGHATIGYGLDSAALARAHYIDHGELVDGIDQLLRNNFRTVFTNPNATLVPVTYQGRQPALFNSQLDAKGLFMASPNGIAVARSIAAIYEATMMTFTTSSTFSCELLADRGYGRAFIHEWVTTVVGVLSITAAVSVILLMLEAQAAVRLVQPHAYVRGLSIIKDPLRFMVSMKDCGAFWERITGGCDASGDLLRNASAGLICKYGEEKATKALEVGHLMFGAPDEVISIRDGREYS